MLRSSKTVDIPVETKSEKRIRYFLAVLFFIQVTLTTVPYMHEIIIDEQGAQIIREVTPIQCIVQLFVSNGEARNILLSVYGFILVLLPMICFFVCIFDKRSRVKYLFSGLTSVICAVLITFSVGHYISIGSVATLIINVAGLFMTMQGVQATTRRMHDPTAQK